MINSRTSEFTLGDKSESFQMFNQRKIQKKDTETVLCYYTIQMAVTLLGSARTKKKTESNSVDAEIPQKWWID